MHIHTYIPTYIYAALAGLELNYVDQAALKLKEPHTSASRGMGLKVYNIPNMNLDSNNNKQFSNQQFYN